MLNCQRSVLIVDRSEETREVLQTVLERHGVRTLAASEPGKAAELARQHQIDLVVLDVESCQPDQARVAAAETDGSSSLTSVRLTPPALLWQGGAEMPVSPIARHLGKQECLSDQAVAHQPYVILLGRGRDWRGAAPDGEFVAKPYHYGPLVRRIEELLGLSMPPTGSWLRGDAVCHPGSGPRQPV